MPFNLREAFARVRSRRAVRLAGAALILALAANLAFAAVTLPEEGWRGLGRVSLRLLALAAMLALIPLATNAARIAIWARFMGRRLGAGDALQVAAASDLGAAFTPTVAGTGAVRLGMLLGHGLSPGRASALILLMTLEDAIFFLVALPEAYLFARGRGGEAVDAVLEGLAARAGLVLAGALVAGLVLTVLWKLYRGRLSEVVSGGGSLGSLLRRWLDWLREARAVFAEVMKRGKLRLAATLVLTSVQWVCRYSVVTAVLAAFGLATYPFADILLQWVVFTAGTFVPTPGGATAVEAAFAVVYQPIVPAELLGPVTAVWRLVIFYLVLVVDAAVLSVFLLRSRAHLAASADRA